jgi:hypothetical protein
MALLKKGRRDDAAKVLAPVLTNPHAGRAAQQARTLLNQGQLGTLDLDDPEGDDDPAPPGTPTPTAPTPPAK